jgi:outer membrane receptor protein involved in Fe transport
VLAFSVPVLPTHAQEENKGRDETPDPRAVPLEPDPTGRGSAAPRSDEAAQEKTGTPPVAAPSQPDSTTQGARLPTPVAAPPNNPIQTATPLPGAATSGDANKPALSEAAGRPFPDQETGEFPNLLSMSLEDLLNLQVTSASKQEETVAEAPSMVTVFTREDIRQLGVRTVEQLLNFVPGFQANPDESDHYLRIDVRGRSTGATESMLMMVDGQRVNELFFGGITTLSHDIPTENIERVEIIRGPGSALYGANAFLGVIDIKTNRSHTDVTVGAGDMNRRYAVINVAKTFGDLKLASFAKLYTDDGKSYPNVTDAAGRTGSAYDPVQTMDSSAALEYRGLYLRARYLTREFDGATCCHEYSRYSGRYSTSQATAQAGYKAALSNDIDLDAFAAFQRDGYQEIFLSEFSQSVGQLDYASVMGFKLTAWSGSANADLQWRILSRDSIKATVMVGGAYAYNRLSHIGSFADQDLSTGQRWNDIYETPGLGIGSYTSQMEKRNVEAGYLQAKVDLWRQLSFTAGARYDYYTDCGGSLNPRAAVVWATPFKSHLKLQYGQAFRAPTILEEGGSKGSLKPETVQTLEAGYVQQILDIAQATVDIFYQRLDDLINFRDFAVVNAGHFATKGLEIEIRTRDVYGAKLMGSYTHLWRQADDPGITSGDFGSAAVNYAWRRLTANVSSTIHGSIKQHLGGDLSSVPTPVVERKTHALFNLRLQAEIAKGVRAFATVNNVFDWRWQPTGLSATLLARGRTFLLGLSADF